VIKPIDEGDVLGDAEVGNRLVSWGTVATRSAWRPLPFDGRAQPKLT